MLRCISDELVTLYMLPVTQMQCRNLHLSKYAKNIFDEKFTKSSPYINNILYMMINWN